MKRVWVDAWQMQCCGRSFSVGDAVEWTLEPAVDIEHYESIVGSAEASRITHHEEHHSDMPATTLNPGIVRSIAAVSCEYAPSKRYPPLRVPVPGTAVLAPKESADGWEKEQGDRSFVAYLVEMEDRGSR